MAWRKIPGFRDYEVMDGGYIRRAKDGRPLKSRPNVDGYPIVRLYTKRSRGRSRGRTVRIHHAVALAFIGPRPLGYQINHKNGVKDDNRSENLEWVTPGQNMRHASRLGLLASGARNGAVVHPDRLPRGESHGCAKLTSRQVIKIRAIYADGSVSLKKIADTYGITAQAVWLIIKRLKWRHLP